MPGDSEKNQADWFSEFKRANQNYAPPKAETTSEGTKKPSDRRRYARFEVDECQATMFREGLLTIFGVGKGNLARAALDLSEGGVRLQIHERIPIGTKVRMIIQMEKYKDQIEASGVVRWCYQSAKHSKDFYAGVEFEELDPAQKRKISLMREWFTSPQYRAVRETARKRSAPEFEM